MLLKFLVYINLTKTNLKKNTFFNFRFREISGNIQINRKLLATVIPNSRRVYGEIGSIVIILKAIVLEYITEDFVRDKHRSGCPMTHFKEHGNGKCKYSLLPK